MAKRLLEWMRLRICLSLSFSRTYVRLYWSMDAARVAPERSLPLVLIVEDDPSTRLLYRDHLNQCGFRTADAHNGHQALAKARELHPDAVLTDLAVPGMDGFEFCHALQQSAATREIPVVAVTGHSEYLDQPDRFRKAGIDEVLIKPCPPDEIAAALHRLLSPDDTAAR
jgi:two-component system, cell cycle response regulator DivK